MEDAAVEIMAYADQLATEFLWGLLVAGLVFCFAGYRCIKYCVYLLGFACGYLVAQALDQNAVASIFVGVASGGVFLLVWYLAAILMGTMIGGLIGVLLALYWSIDVFIMGAFCAGIGGCMMVWLRKMYLMMATAAGGAFALISAGSVLAEIDIEHTWVAWWIIFFVAGFLVQIGVPSLLKKLKSQKEEAPKET